MNMFLIAIPYKADISPNLSDYKLQIRKITYNHKVDY